MRRDWRGAVVVLTGASTGIGRAAARELARRGAAVVLAARRREMLEEVSAECVDLGGSALAVPTDVRDEAAVRELARVAFERFGRIDVWVNNAGVAVYGRVEEAPYPPGAALDAGPSRRAACRDHGLEFVSPPR